MAYFAKLDVDNTVMSVVKLDDEFCQNAEGQEVESIGIEYLKNVHGWDSWKQTSYNTRNGKYYDISSGKHFLAEDQSKSFRKNYAGRGYTYDETRDAFIPPKPYSSWILNETTCQWEAPIAKPTITTYGDNKFYGYWWDENTLKWVGEDEEDPKNNLVWNSETLSWDVA